MVDEAVADFLEALEKKGPRFNVELRAEAKERLVEYYEIIARWNPRLHLVAPCSAEEFATRHVLESLAALPFLSEDARVADIGSGGGLPIIPLLIALPNMHATLIESSSKKAIFLREALKAVGASARAKIIAERFEETPRMLVNFVTCRAIERFTEKFKELIKWSPPASTLLFFGGPSLEEEIEKSGLRYQSLLIPESERRFLFRIER